MSDSRITIEEELDAVLAQLNSDYADTVLFVVRHLTARHAGIERSTVLRGHLASIGPSRIGASAAIAGGANVEIGWDFTSEPNTADDVRGQLFELLGEARAAAPDGDPLTSLERELAGRETPTHLSTVVAVTDLNPALRQITFGGLDQFVSLDGDQFMYVLAPPPGQHELTIGMDFTWSRFEEMPDAERPVGAYYTVRRWRPEQREVDMWFALHDHAGPASSWAADAAVGCPVALWGPRTIYSPAAHASHFVIVVDDSGLGAAAAILDQLLARPNAPTVTVIAETTSPATTIELPTQEGVTIRWLFRADRPAGTGTELLAAVRDLDLDPARTDTFGAAESRQITSVRTHLRQQVGLRADRVSMTGYWRREADAAEVR
ncbi:MAG: siderophore-interacting protein [Ilumatobacter sp.]